MVPKLLFYILFLLHHSAPNYMYIPYVPLKPRRPSRVQRREKVRVLRVLQELLHLPRHARPLYTSDAADDITVAALGSTLMPTDE